MELRNARRAPRSAVVRMAVYACVFLSQVHAPAHAQPVPTVTVAPPLAKTITDWDEFTGRFEAVATVEIRPRVSGLIDALHFRDGQIVTQGQQLFTIDPRPYQFALDAARADVERYAAQAELANLDVRRGEPLAAGQAIAQRELDSRRSIAKVAEAQREAAIAALGTASLNLQWTNVVSPIAGRISNRRVDVGNLVEGGLNVAQPTLLTTVVALDPIYFVFDAAEADYIKYARLDRSGVRASGRESTLPVELRLQDEKDFTHKGHLDFVDNALNVRSATIRSRAVFTNPDAFFTPGMFGRIRLFAGESKALLVPDTAIQSDQAQKIVLVVGEDNVVAARVVTPGPISDGLRVIRDGLKPDDHIIINGAANPFVRPGAKVTPQPGQIKPAGAAG